MSSKFLLKFCYKNLKSFLNNYANRNKIIVYKLGDCLTKNLRIKFNS